MPVRPMREDDRPAVAAMMAQLWPDEDPADYDFGEALWVWEGEDGALGGYVAAALRPWANGCQSTPCPYIEGWWVAPELRRRGVGRALFAAVEDWARRRSGPIGPEHRPEAGATCGVCPVCSGIALLREVKPETVEHLLDAAASVVAALRSAVVPPSPSDGPGRAAGVEHIDVREG